MGQIASDNVNNLAYWSRKPRVAEPLPHNPPAPAPAAAAEAFNSSQIYVAFLVGDGDNVAYLKSSRREWISNRLAMCKQRSPADGKCAYPLLWTMSPHILGAEIMNFVFKTRNCEFVY